MAESSEWVLMAYRLPREPSTPRISVWRKLRQLGAEQLVDGLVALPLSSRNREQFAWLAQEVVEAAGQASIWISTAGTAAQDRGLKSLMLQRVAAEYRDLTATARAARSGDAIARRRALIRLRRELRRLVARDYFAAPERNVAEAAIERLAAVAIETPS